MRKTHIAPIDYCFFTFCGRFADQHALFEVELSDRKIGELAEQLETLRELRKGDEELILKLRKDNEKLKANLDNYCNDIKEPAKK